LNPKMHIAYNGKGFALQKLNRWEQSILFHEVAILVNPGYSSAYLVKI
jgi:hypothetical protein